MPLMASPLPLQCTGGDGAVTGEGWIYLRFARSLLMLLEIVLMARAKLYSAAPVAWVMN
jgi:hypothetical protein